MTYVLHVSRNSRLQRHVMEQEIFLSELSTNSQHMVQTSQIASLLLKQVSF